VVQPTASSASSQDAVSLFMTGLQGIQPGTGVAAVRDAARRGG